MRKDTQIKHTVALFGDSDSQIFGLLPHANAFRNRGWNVSILIDKSSSIPAGLLKRVSDDFSTFHVPRENLPNYILEGNFKVAGVFSRASHLHRFRLNFEKQCLQYSENRPGIFTGYNGLTYEKFEEGLAWRLGYDVVALNGPRDGLLLEEFVKFSDCHAQPYVTTGLAQSKLGLRDTNSILPTKQNPNRKLFVFAEQVVVPTTKAERRYLVSQLIQIATSNPEWDIFIKCRIRKSEKTFHDVKYHLEKILKEFRNRPKNLKISYDNLPDLLKRASLFGTISSTAIFESLNASVPSIVISDFGIKNSHGTHVFSNSGVATKLSDIRDLALLEDIEPSEEWLEWVGASNIQTGSLINFFEIHQFKRNNFTPQYFSEADIEIWQRSKKRFKFNPYIQRLLEKWTSF